MILIFVKWNGPVFQWCKVGRRCPITVQRVNTAVLEVWLWIVLLTNETEETA